MAWMGKAASQLLVRLSAERRGESGCVQLCPGSQLLAAFRMDRINSAWCWGTPKRSLSPGSSSLWAWYVMGTGCGHHRYICMYVCVCTVLPQVSRTVYKSSTFNNGTVAPHCQTSVNQRRHGELGRAGLSLTKWTMWGIWSFYIAIAYEQDFLRIIWRSFSCFCARSDPRGSSSHHPHEKIWKAPLWMWQAGRNGIANILSWKINPTIPQLNQIRLVE